MKTFSARETLWLKELDGIELANLWPRALALTIDGVLSFVMLIVVFALGGLVYLGISHLTGHQPSLQEVTTYGGNIVTEHPELKNDGLVKPAPDETTANGHIYKYSYST